VEAKKDKLGVKKEKENAKEMGIAKSKSTKLFNCIEHARQ
jgi:hypothetical protein